MKKIILKLIKKDLRVISLDIFKELNLFLKIMSKINDLLNIYLTIKRNNLVNFYINYNQSFCKFKLIHNRV